MHFVLLDASKAFDRIDHWLLFDKMIKKGVPLFIIKLLFFLVLTSENVPPVFVLQMQMHFNLYMDDLSVKLNCSGIGGYIGTSFINDLCYADDLCLISVFR